MQKHTDRPFKEIRETILALSENFNQEIEIIKKNKTNFEAIHFNQ